MIERLRCAPFRTLALPCALVGSLLFVACGKSKTAETPPADAHAQTPTAAEQAADMHAEHAGEVPTATPAATTAPAQPVVGERVVYATVGGRQITGYLSRPVSDNGSRGGLIVIHEWWGLNDNIQAMTNRLAGEGYTALAIDLFDGTVASDASQAQKLYEGAMTDLAAVRTNLDQAYAFLAGRPGIGRIGSLGWCFGGAISLEAARHLGDRLWGAVIYYGSVDGDRERLSGVQAPILGLFGGADRAIPVDSVRAFEKALNDLGKPVEIVIYDGAGHAFANPSGQSYDAKAAEDSWQRTLDFLRVRLGGAGA